MGPTGTTWCGNRQLVQAGATNYVVAPQIWDERGRRVKTDRRDVRELCQRLNRYVRGNTEVFAVVRVPSEAQERRRLVCRQRTTLLRERQRCELRGHGLMLLQGLDAPGGWWEAALWRDLAPQLPPWLLEHLERCNSTPWNCKRKSSG